MTGTIVRLEEEVRSLVLPLNNKIDTPWCLRSREAKLHFLLAAAFHTLQSFHPNDTAEMILYTICRNLNLKEIDNIDWDLVKQSGNTVQRCGFALPVTKEITSTDSAYSSQSYRIDYEFFNDLYSSVCGPESDNITIRFSSPDEETSAGFSTYLRKEHTIMPYMPKRSPYLHFRSKKIGRKWALYDKNKGKLFFTNIKTTRNSTISFTPAQICLLFGETTKITNQLIEILNYFRNIGVLEITFFHEEIPNKKSIIVETMNIAKKLDFGISITTTDPEWLDKELLETIHPTVKVLCESARERDQVRGYVNFGKMAYRNVEIVYPYNKSTTLLRTKINDIFSPARLLYMPSLCYNIAENRFSSHPLSPYPGIFFSAKEPELSCSWAYQQCIMKHVTFFPEFNGFLRQWEVTDKDFNT